MNAGCYGPAQYQQSKWEKKRILLFKTLDFLAVTFFDLTLRGFLSFAYRVQEHDFVFL